MWENKLDCIGELRFELQKNNVTSRFLNGECVLNTKFTASQDIFLNETASFIFNTILEQKEMAVSDVINKILSEYDTEDTERVKIDVVNTLHSLWKLAVIRWVSVNPFAPEPVPCNKGKIIKITHDSVADVLRFMKSAEQYVDYRTGKVKKDDLMRRILHDLTPTYAYIEDEEIACLISVLKFGQSYIVQVGHKGNYNHLRLLLEHIIAHETEIKIMLFEFLGCTKNEKELAIQLGFKFAGELKEETTDGGVEVYAH